MVTTFQHEYMLTFLYGFVSLVEKCYAERDCTAIWLPEFALGFNHHPGVNGIANVDRSEEFPMNFEKGQSRALNETQSIQQAQIEIVNQRTVRYARPKGAI